MIGLTETPWLQDQPGLEQLAQPALWDHSGDYTELRFRAVVRDYHSPDILAELTCDSDLRVTSALTALASSRLALSLRAHGRLSWMLTNLLVPLRQQGIFHPVVDLYFVCDYCHTQWNRCHPWPLLLVPTGRSLTFVSAPTRQSRVA